MPWRSALLAIFVTLFLHFLVVFVGEFGGDTAFDAFPESLPFDFEPVGDSRPCPECIDDWGRGVPALCTPGSTSPLLFVGESPADVFKTGRLGGGPDNEDIISCMQEACCELQSPIPDVRKVDGEDGRARFPGDRHVLGWVGDGAMVARAF
jgi:hypothetical protein